MTDDELKKWWPDLGVVLTELRRIDQSAVVDLLVGAVCAGASSSEILGGVGNVLKDFSALHPKLNESARRAWDAVMADVYRAFPGSRLSLILACLA